MKKTDKELVEELGQIENRMLDKDLGIHGSEEDETRYWEIVGYFWEQAKNERNKDTVL